MPVPKKKAPPKRKAAPMTPYRKFIVVGSTDSCKNLGTHPDGYDTYEQAVREARKTATADLTEGDAEYDRYLVSEVICYIDLPDPEKIDLPYTEEVFK